MKNIPFLETLYTKHDAAVLLDRVETLEKSLYNVKDSFEKALKEIFSFADAQEFRAQIAQAGISLTSSDALRVYLDSLKKELQDMPVATITLAVTPTTDTVRHISRWFETHMGQRVLLDLQIDHTLIGGVILEYQGKYADYSLQKVLQSRFERTQPTTH